MTPARLSASGGIAAGWKLAGMVALGGLVLATSSIPALGVAVGLGFAASMRWTGTRGAASALLSVAMAGVVVTSGVAGLLGGGEVALLVLLRFTALFTFAHVLTSTTSSTEIEDAVVAALRPLERLRFVSAWKVGLAMALAIRSLPRLRDAVAEIREAHAARGLRPSPFRLIVPLMARMLRDADMIAEAVEARSWPPRPVESDE